MLKLYSLAFRTFVLQVLSIVLIFDWLGDESLLVVSMDMEVIHVDVGLSPVFIHAIQVYVSFDGLLPLPRCALAFELMQNFLHFAPDIDLMQLHCRLLIFARLTEHPGHEGVQHQDSLVLLDLTEAGIVLLDLLVRFSDWFRVLFNFFTFD